MNRSGRFTINGKSNSTIISTSAHYDFFLPARQERWNIEGLCQEMTNGNGMCRKNTPTLSTGRDGGCLPGKVELLKVRVSFPLITYFIAELYGNVLRGQFSATIETTSRFYDLNSCIYRLGHIQFISNIRIDFHEVHGVQTAG